MSFNSGRSSTIFPSGERIQTQAVLTSTVQACRRGFLVQRHGPLAVQAGAGPRPGAAAAPLSSVGGGSGWRRETGSAGLVGQPLVPVLVEVEGVDDAQGTVAGGQLAGRRARTHTHTHHQQSALVKI